MYEYSHGGNAIFESGKANIIDLSANINPLGIPENVRTAIISAIQDCDRYPDNFSVELRRKTAEFEQIANPDWIFFGNGASDIIFRLPRAILSNERTKKVMVAAPTFSDYERSALSFGAEIMRHTLSVADGFNMEDSFINAVRSHKPSLVYLCNPNNPTGVVTEIGRIKELLDCCQEIGAWLAVDECFLDFTEQLSECTSKVFLEKYSNLVILKAFTKVFALPGIRLGYALCSNTALIEKLYFHGADWPVSNLAQSAGMAALEGAMDYIRRTVEYVSNERQLLKKGLTRLGYKVFESEANYVFFQNPYSFDLREELDKMGIRIRSCGNYHGLDDSYYRIAVSRSENNAKLLDAITQIIKIRRFPDGSNIGDKN